MLQFLRQYQRFFFLIITIVTIASFSFFGTYQAITSKAPGDAVAFTTLGGTNVTRQEMEDFLHFIGSDFNDYLTTGGVYGNFLNDGVVRNDLFATGLAGDLADAYMEDLKGDFAVRLEREKRFHPYTHPQAKFLTAEAVWRYFAPEIKENLDFINTQKDATSRDLFNARVHLYLAEGRFPQAALRHMLRYQQKQYEWITEDPVLMSEDLSLFRYHTLEDWFGRRFVTLMVQVIMNSADIAEQRGYKVSHEEALSSLIYNAQTSYKHTHRGADITVAGSTSHMDDLLVRMGLDRNRAVKMWRKVLLFRRIVQDAGDGVVVDRLAYNNFHAYACESANIEVYRLPGALRLNDFRALQRFEVYTQAVSPSYDASLKALTVPTTYYDAAVVQKDAPELVQRRYTLTFAEADKNALQSKVGIKEMWQWQVDDTHWKTLQQQFPDLGVSSATSRQERFAALDALDQHTRAKVDAFARAAIVETHPEWIDEALSLPIVEKGSVSLRIKGGNFPFKGVVDRKALLSLLDTASVGQESPQDNTPLFKFTQDNSHYYRITVVERNPNPEILSLAEASTDGTLDALVDASLEKHYASLKDTAPEKYRGVDGKFKFLPDVKGDVAESLFATQLQTVRGHLGGEKPATPDVVASHRLDGYMRTMRKAVIAGQNDAVVASSETQGTSSLADQWKLVKETQDIQRCETTEASTAKAFTMSQGAWSEVASPVNGDMSFFHLVKRTATDNDLLVYTKMHQAQSALGNVAMRSVMKDIVEIARGRHAIVLPHDENVPESNTKG